MLPRQDVPAQRRRALWISSSLTTYGGIATFVRNMRDTQLWTDWHVRHVATHCDGSKLTRLSIFASGFVRFLFELVWHRPDIVHLHTSERGSFVRKGLMLWVSSLLGVPTVLHMHGGEFDDYYEKSSPSVKRCISATLNRATTVIALGAAWRERLQAAGPESRIVVVPNAIRLEEAVDQHAVDSVQVVFLGELCERKGINVLLDSWAKLTDFQMETRATLIVAGWGDIERAQAQIESLKIGDSVQLVGCLSPSETRQLLSVTQVLVLPSTNEGQPMAILEAMARGICVVSTTVGGIPEMIGHSDGVLVPPGDRDKLAQALALVLKSESSRRHFGDHARKRVESEFDVDVVSQRFDTLYRQILSETFTDEVYAERLDITDSP